MKTRLEIPDKNQLYLWNTGGYYNAFEIFGAHEGTFGGEKGVRFTVWAPEVKSVAAIGDFNDWMEPGFVLEPLESSGVWTCFIPGAKSGQKYKYLITTGKGTKKWKADPFAFYSEKRPATASIIHSFKYQWNDSAWIKKREATDHFKEPKNIYEVHLGSWKQHNDPTDLSPDERNADCSAFCTYRELAETLVPYVKKMGYTHMEIMPLMEHPYDGSWGYQITGYYAATSRYGTPEDLMYFIDKAHEAGIGVILDWVPGHFCRDEQGLVRFNGHKLYEKVEHPDWGTFKFDFGRKQVRSFLLSNAMFWLKMYHADGLRIDGVSSMLYLNFGINDPKKKKFNKFGDERDLEAVSFCQELSEMVGKYFPGTFTVAEESSAWPLVTYPPKDGGLGFHYKWDMGWMNDTLEYVSKDFPFRPGVHDRITFSMMYAFNENYILPLSHDEVVHGKASLIGKQPGEYWRQFAGLRLLALYQMTHPGGKLNFMGSEFGQFIEWRYYEGLEWFLVKKFDTHRKHLRYIKELNHLYRNEKALWSQDKSWDGFMWIDANNAKQRLISFVRTSASGRTKDLVVLNFDVFTHDEYRIGVPLPGKYREIFNSDEKKYGGNGDINEGIIKAEKVPYHGQKYSIRIKIPSLGGMIIKRVGR